MTRRLHAVSLFAAVALVGIAAAPAPKADPAAQIKIRHDGMKQIGGAMKILVTQVKSGAPDAAVVAPQAATMKRLAIAQLDWFPKGSGPESGLKTHAKAEVWSDPVAFKAAQQKLVTEATKLDMIAAKGDMTALGPQVMALGGTCKGCHEKYKEKDED